MADVDAAFEEFDSLVADVRRSRYQMFEDNVRRWLRLIDNDENFEPIVQGYSIPLAEFDAWYAECEKSVGSWIGSGRLSWPSDQEKRVGLQLGLFRAFAEERLQVFNFCSSFLHRDGGFDVNVSDVVTQIFMPLAADLRRHAVRRWTNRNELYIPAADREVSIDHNSAQYPETIEALQRLMDLLRQSEVAGAESDQRIAELAAGRTLLQSIRVRIAAVGAVLFSCLRFLAGKFVKNAIGVVATAIIAGLAALLGLHLS